MRLTHKIALGVAASIALGLGVAASFAHPVDMSSGMMPHMGPAFGAGMRGPMAMQMRTGDAAFADDMRLVHDMLFGHDRIRRTVTNLPDGIRTVTESDDPQLAQTIQKHVARMQQRLDEGRVFNLFSPTLPVLFENKDKIRTKVEMTDKGCVVTQTSTDASVVSALQAHAVEVSELAREGPLAMMRSARAAMASGVRGPHSGMGPASMPPQAR